MATGCCEDIAATAPPKIDEGMVGAGRQPATARCSSRSSTPTRCGPGSTPATCPTSTPFGHALADRGAACGCADARRVPWSSPATWPARSTTRTTWRSPSMSPSGSRSPSTTPSCWPVPSREADGHRSTLKRSAPPRPATATCSTPPRSRSRSWSPTSPGVRQRGGDAAVRRRPGRDLVGPQRAAVRPPRGPRHVERLSGRRRSRRMTTTGLQFRMVRADGAELVVIAMGSLCTWDGQQLRPGDVRGRHRAGTGRDPSGSSASGSTPRCSTR